MVLEFTDLQSTLHGLDEMSRFWLFITIFISHVPSIQVIQFLIIYCFLLFLCEDTWQLRFRLAY